MFAKLNFKTMQVFTEEKQKRITLIGEIKKEFHELKALPGSQKTAIYKALADKYKISDRTVISYLKK